MLLKNRLSRKSLRQRYRRAMAALRRALSRPHQAEAASYPPLFTGLQPLEPRILLNGDIGGIVFDDLNANGQQDQDEQGMAGVVVYLDANNNRELDGGEQQSVTEADGRYLFEDLPVGEYTVRQVTPEGYYFAREFTEADKPTLQYVLTSDESSGRYGSSVAVHGDRAIVGDYANSVVANNKGAVYMYDLSSGEILWTSRASVLGSHQHSQQYGSALAMNDDFILVGHEGFFDPDGTEEPFWSGAVHVMDAQTNEYLHRLVPADSSEQKRFGASVELHGDLALIGRERDADAYLFNARTGEQLFKFSPDPSFSNSTFGNSLALSDQYAVIGNSNAHVNQVQSGIVHVFDVASGELIRVLQPENPAVEHHFGTNVAVHGNYVLVGGYRVGDGPDKEFAVSIFDVRTGELVRNLIADDLTWGSAFGGSIGTTEYKSIAVQGGLVFVGAYDQSGDIDGAGAVYVFNLHTGEQLATIHSDNPQRIGRFGQMLSLDGNNLLVSSRRTPEGDYTGSIVVFEVTDIDSVSASISHEMGLVDVDFPTVAEPVDIHGAVWVDKNNDGLIQSDEPFESDVTVYIDENGNSAFDAGEIFQVTDDRGRYAFENLLAGAYTIGIVAPENHTLLSPVEAPLGTGTHNVTLLTGQVAGDVNFAVFPESADVVGAVWDDANANGLLDSGESGIEGVIVYIDTDGDAIRDESERFTVTAVDGSYSFPDLYPELTTVRVELPDFYGETTPSGLSVLASAPSTILEAVTDSPRGSGNAVAISDGKIVKGPGPIYEYPNGLSAAMIFDAATGDLLGQLEPPKSENPWLPGYHRNISVHGSYAIVGDSGNADNGTASGAAYVFDLDTNEFVTTLKPQEPRNLDYFGDSVALNDSYAVVGSRGNGDGRAFLFSLSSGNQIQEYKPTDSGVHISYGAHVAIDGNYVVISNRNDNTHGLDSGAVYIFELESGKQINKIYSPEPAAHQRFGSSLSAGGGKFAVKAENADSARPPEIYVYKISTGEFLHTLIPEEDAVDTSFGNKINIDGDTVAVSAAYQDYQEVDSGAVFVFSMVTGEQIAKLVSDRAVQNEQFGSDLAVDGNQVVVTNRDGEVYQFDLRNVTHAQYRYLEPASAISSVNFGLASNYIGDTVWRDLNGNGIQDENEPGLEGVTVQLLDVDSNMLQSTTTDEFGNYLFDGLSIDQYQVRVVAPDSFVFTHENIGPDEFDSDFGAETVVANVNLVFGGQIDSLDAGLVAVPEISNVNVGADMWYRYAQGPLLVDVQGTDDVDMDFKLFIDWNDGNPPQEVALSPGQSQVQLQHFYDGSNTYGAKNVRLWLANDVISGPVTEKSIFVHNSYPTPDAGGDYVSYEGIPILLDGSSSFDETGESLEYTWSLYGVNGYSRYGQIGYGEKLLLARGDLSELNLFNGTHRLSLTVEDQEGNYLRDYFELVVIGHMPTVAVDQSEIVGGLNAPVWNSGTFHDPDGDPVIVTASIGDVTQDAEGNWQWEGVTDALDPGIHEIIITATDDKGAFANTTFSLRVNRAPVANAGGNYVYDEYQQVWLSAYESFDPDGDRLSYFWDLNNDGVWDFEDSWYGILPRVSEYPELNLPTDGTPFQVKLRVVDEYGGFDEDFATVTLNETAPKLDGKRLSIVHNVEQEVIDLHYSDADPLTASIQIFDGNYLDWKLKEDLGLFRYIPQFDNRLPQRFRWYLGAGNEFYLLESNGDLHRWTGDGDNLDKVAELTNVTRYNNPYWSDPESLLDLDPFPHPPQDLASFDPVTKQLIFASNGYVGNATVMVTLSDGKLQTTDYFHVEFTNRTIDFDKDDMSIDHQDGQQVYQPPLFDDDGDPLTYTVSVMDGSQSAWELDQQYNFSRLLPGSGAAFNSSNRYILGVGGIFEFTREGEFRKWNGPNVPGDVLGYIDPYYFNHANELIDVTKPDAVPDDLVVFDSETGRILVNPEQFGGRAMVYVTADDGVEPFMDIFMLDVANRVPNIDIGNIYYLYSAGEQRYELPLEDYEGDRLYYEIQLTDVSQQAFDAVQAFGLVDQVSNPTGLDIDVPWFVNNRNQYFGIDTNGDLYQWTRNRFDPFKIVGNVGGYYYVNPDLLLDVEPNGPLPDGIVTVDHETNELVVNGGGFFGGIHVDVIASDGIDQTTDDFEIALDNPAPFLDLPNAELHHAAGLHGAEMPRFDFDGDAVSYKVTYKTVEQLAYDTAMQYGITRRIAARDGFYNANEHWYLGNGGLYIVDTLGNLRKWDPRARILPDNEILETLTQDYYQNPDWLLNTNPPEQVDGLAFWDPQGWGIVVDPTGFVGTAFVTVEIGDGFRTHESTFQFDVTNTPPTLDLPDIDVSHKAGEHRIALPKLDDDSDNLTYTFNTIDPNQLAWEADQQYNFSRYIPGREAVFGLGARWLLGNGGIFLLFENGDLRKWAAGRTAEANPFIANVGAAFYDNPEGLIDVQQPAALPDGLVTFDEVTHELVIHTDGFQGDAVLNVMVSDGATEVTDSFEFTVTNVKPKLDLQDMEIPHTDGEQRIALPPKDADGDDVIYTVTVTDPKLLAWQADQQYNFSRYIPGRENVFGLGAKWVLGNGGIYLLFDNGDLRKWAAGRTAEDNPFIANVGADYYDNPEALIDVQLPTALPDGIVTIDEQTSELVIDPTFYAGDALVTVLANDGVNFEEFSFKLTVKNAAPVLDLLEFNSTSHTRVDGRSYIRASDSDDDHLTYTVSVVNAKQFAYEADQKYNFSRYLPGREHVLNLNARWVMGDGGIYLVFANGDLRKWAGGRTPEANPFIAHIGKAFYDNPELLIDVQPPDAVPDGLVSIAEDNVFFLFNGLGFVGTAVVTVTASDGVTQVTDSFNLDVKDRAPEVRTSDRKYSHTLDEARISLQKTDDDDQPVDYTIKVSTPEQVAWDTDQLLKFSSVLPGIRRINGTPTRWLVGEDGIYLLRHDGRIYRREVGGDIDRNPLVATVHEDYYQNPELLVDPPQPVDSVPDDFITYDEVNRQIVVKPTLYFGEVRVDVTGTDGKLSAHDFFNVEITNAAPDVRLRHVSVSRNDDPYVIDLPKTDVDNEEIDYQVDVQTAGEFAFEIKNKFNLVEYKPEFDNRYGLHGKWFISKDGEAYYVIPQGQLFRYDGANLKVVVENITSYFWYHPQDLIDAQPDPGVSDEVFNLDNVAKTLTLDPRQYLGTMVVTVLASDGTFTSDYRFEFETYL